MDPIEFLQTSISIVKNFFVIIKAHISSQIIMSKFNCTQNCQIYFKHEDILKIINNLKDTIF